jgi:hypothetical protein
MTPVGSGNAGMGCNTAPYDRVRAEATDRYV